MVRAGRPVVSLLFIAVLGLTVYLVLVPLVVLIVASVNATGAHLPFERPGIFIANYLTVLRDGGTYRLLLNSTIFAVGSTVIGIGMAVFFAWLIERTNIIMRRVLFVAVLVPMAIPNMIYATSWLQLLDAHAGLVPVTLAKFGIPFPVSILSLGGMIFIQGTALASNAYLLVAGALRNVDPTLEEQSAIAGKGVWQTLCRVTLPILRPALFAVIVFFAMVCIETFDVPGMVGLSAGVQVLSTRIYWLTHPEGGQLPDYGTASALALLLVIIALMLITLYEAQLKRGRRYVTITARGYRPSRIKLGPLQLPLLVLALGLLVITVALPLFMLVWRSLLRFYVYPSPAAFGRLSFSAYRALVDEPTMIAVLRNTVLMSVATVVVTLSLSALVAWLTVRSPITASWRRRLRMLALTPQGIPSVVIGIAFVLTYLRVPIPIYGTVWIIALALSTKFIAYTTAALTAAHLQIAPELEEASLMAGADEFATYRRVLFPLLTPALANCVVWVLIQAIRELVIALMLYSPSSQVLSTQVWGLWQNGVMDQLCALGVVSALVLAGLLSLPALLPRRWRWLPV